MKTKEYRHLSRRQLLQMLIEQMEENQQLRHQLDNRKMVMQTSGSIAEAALRLNGVFEAADRAAQEYLRNVRRQSMTQYIRSVGKELEK